MTLTDIEELTRTQLPVAIDENVADFTKYFIDNVSVITNINPTNRNQLIDAVYRDARKLFRIGPSKQEIREAYNILYKHVPIDQSLSNWLVKRAMRKHSGVKVVSVLTTAGNNTSFSCPEKCAYCPTETDLEGNPTHSKSYVSGEPLMDRSERIKKSGEIHLIRGQVWDRLRSYFRTGNIMKSSNKEKIEVIVSGGTWDVLPYKYREQTIQELYWAFNTFGQDNPRDMFSVDKEISINETSQYAVIGLTIETRPDYISKTSIKSYLKWGITRVQIGVQHYDDFILSKLNRGCYKYHTIKAIALLKSVGLKVVVHLMPDLPYSTPEKDIEMFHCALTDPDIQFDDLKIYPCAVVKSSRTDRIVTSTIAEWYNQGTYKPYSEKNIEDLIRVCKYYKSRVKPHVRIQRLVRDLPSTAIEAGYNKVTNLRQVIQNQMKKDDTRCLCIRCMEVKDHTELNNKVHLVVRPYQASKGIEYHISIEAVSQYWNIAYIWFLICSYISFYLLRTEIWYGGNNDNYIGCIGFLRLRIDPNPGGGFVPELEGAGLIREVHVYGEAIGVGDSTTISSQHRGYGRLLVKTAENIIKKHGLKKSAVISGIGSREYYKNKCGYIREGTYMVKFI